MNTLSPLTELKGIGEKTEKLFAKVGVTNVGELLSYYPRTYETYGEIQKPDAVTDGMTAALYGQFQGPLAVKRVKTCRLYPACSKVMHRKYASPGIICLIFAAP